MAEPEVIDHLLLPDDQIQQTTVFEQLDKPRGLRRSRPPPLESLDSNREPLSPLTPKTLTTENSKRWGFRVRSSKPPKQTALGDSRLSFHPTSPSLQQRPLTGSRNRKSFMSTKNLRSSYLPSLNSPLPPYSPVTPTIEIPHLVPKGSIAAMRSKSPAMPPRSRSTDPLSSSSFWEPPPLFQAFPQALKHGNLETSAMSADLILQLDNNKRLSDQRTEMMRSSNDNDTAKLRKADRKEAKLRKQYKEKASKLATKADWVQKVYVLATSGHLLQYAADGDYKRLPEESLQLGQSSVAFVSDAIPGKHWVLQVSRTADEDGHIAVESSKSFISKFSFKKSETRPPPTSFLMIFSSGEDMDGWMQAIRKEIEARGGKKYGSDATSQPECIDEKPRLKSTPSQRYLIKRDPNLFSDASDGLIDAVDDDKEEEEEVDEIPLLHTSSTAVKRHSFRPSFDSPSISNSTVVSNDQFQLENLREGSRLSYMSSGGWTNATSQDSSPGLSPENDQCAELEEEPSWLSVGEASGNALGMADRRRSMLAGYGSKGDQGPTSEQQTLSKPLRPHSTFGSPDALTRSPSTPNFSFPQASKRISVARTPISQINGPSRQPNIPAQLAEKESDEELKSRPTSTLGELPSREDFTRSRSSKNHEETPSVESASLSHTNAGSTKRPMTPDDFYPQRLSELPSLSSLSQLTEIPDVDMVSLTRSHSRSSSSATQRNWPFRPSPSKANDIVLDPPPQRHSVTPRSPISASGDLPRSESEHSFSYSTSSEHPSSASFHTAASLPRSHTQPLGPVTTAPSVSLFEEPLSFAWPPKAFSSSPPAPKSTQAPPSTTATAAPNLPGQRVLRRPISMQVRGAATFDQNFPSQEPKTLQTSAWLEGVSTKPPPRRAGDRIRKRKSLPVLLAGPPPVPPPNCPLPEVPTALGA